MSHARKRIPTLNVEIQNGELNLDLGSFSGDVEKAMAFIRDFCKKNKVSMESNGYDGNLYVNGVQHGITPYGLDLNRMLRFCGSTPAAFKSSTAAPPGGTAPLEKKHEAIQQKDLQVAATLTMLRVNVQAIIQDEPSDPATQLAPEKIKKFKDCLALLNSSDAQLKAAQRPALELAECQYQLSDLHAKCPNTYGQAFNNNPKRIIAGITHCANTIRFAREVEDKEQKNNLIIHSIIKLTGFLGEPQAASALDLLAGQKKDFLNKLRGHLSRGLESLEVTENLSAQGKEKICAATQPLLNFIQQILFPPQVRFSLFRKPLMLAGAAAGLYLGYSTGGFLNTALLTALWGAAGSKTGEAADLLTEKCKRSPS